MSRLNVIKCDQYSNSLHDKLTWIFVNIRHQDNTFNVL